MARTKVVSKQWNKSDIKKVEEQLLALGSGRSEEVMQRAAVTSSRVLFEVEALEHALELVINRAGAIHEAQEKRRHKVLAITWNKEGLPRDLISDFRGPDLWERRQDYVALQEQQAHEQLSPEAQAQAIYADTPLFATSFMKQQLPFSSHKGLLMYDSEKRFCKDAWRAHQQLKEREALKNLMTAADAQEAVALETLTKVANLAAEAGLEYPWWCSKDNKAILYACWQRGVFLHRKHTRDARKFVQQLTEDSATEIDFTARIKHKASDRYMRCVYPCEGGSAKATMIFNDQAKERFETFVIGQLKHLLACILDPAVLEKHLRIQADREKLGRGERFDPNWYHRYSPLDDEPEDVGADADASKENQGGPNAGPESGSKISEAEEKRAKLGPANQSQAIRSDVSGAMQPASKRLKLAGVWSAADAHCTYTVGPLSPAEVTHSAAHQCAEGLAHTARATGVIKEVQPQAVQRHVLQQSSEVSDLLQQRV